MASIARALGFRFFEREKRGQFHLRLSWAEISGGFGFSLGLMWYGDDDDDCSLNIRLGWPNIYFKMRLPRPYARQFGEFGPNYGFTFHRDDVHLNWGDKCKIVHFPWDFDWVRTSLLMADGTWMHELGGNLRRLDFPNYPLAPDERRGCMAMSYQDVKKLMWREEYPYLYKLKSGEVQERTATVSVEEREWRWRWLKWLPLNRKIRRTIAIEFSDEVGERSGSWKGGCTGCGYELLPQETPQDALRRMEAERKF